MAIKRQGPPMSAGATLKHWDFADLDLKQEEIVERLKVSLEHLSAVLNNKAPLSAELAAKIEEEFGISADVLMRVEIRHQLYTIRARQEGTRKAIIKQLGLTE